MKKKRTKRIEICVTDEEYQQLLERKTKPRLAEWLRELALKEKKVPPIIKADPDLIFALARIGSNINQIARLCNTSFLNKSTGVQVLLELQKISNDLNEIKNNDSQIHR